MGGRIPQQFIDDLLNRVDIVEIVDRRVPLKKAGSNFTACCPFHNEKTPSFTVSPTKQFYHCFGCGANGSAVGFLMAYERLDFVETIESLAQSVGLEVPYEGGAPAHSGAQHDTLYRLLESCADYYRTQLRRHPKAADYLKARGLGSATADGFGIGYAPPGWRNLLDTFDGSARELLTSGMLVSGEQGNPYDRFRDRIMFPIRDRRGRVIAFGGRVMDDALPKYLNSPESPLFHKGRELYGYFEARTARRDLTKLIIVEGYMDVVALAQQGVDYAVATLGTATTGEHLERVFRTVPELIFCFDGDKAGRRAAWHALEIALPSMRDGREAKFLFLPEGEDPDSLVQKAGRDDFEKRLEGAVPLAEYLLEELGKKVDTATIGGRVRLVELARPLIKKLPPGLYGELLTQQLGALANLDGQNLRAKMADETTERPPRPAPPSHQRISMTPIRTAIALLIRQPSLVAELAPQEEALRLEQAGIAVLQEIVKVARGNTELHSGALLEHFRDSPEAPALAKLASWELPVSGNDREAAERREFVDAIARLRTAYNRQRTAALLRESQNHNLSPDAKTELQSRLGRRRVTSD